jgi:hypothetical protein
MKTEVVCSSETTVCFHQATAVRNSSFAFVNNVIYVNYAGGLILI